MNPVIRWRTDWVSEEDAIKEIASIGEGCSKARREEELYYARQTIYFLLMGVVEEIEEEKCRE